MIVTKDAAHRSHVTRPHSRPHKVDKPNDYDVFDEFVKSARKLANPYRRRGIEHRPEDSQDDARTLSFLVRRFHRSVSDVAPVPERDRLPPRTQARTRLVWGGRQARSRELRGEVSRGSSAASPP